MNVAAIGAGDCVGDVARIQGIKHPAGLRSNQAVGEQLNVGSGGSTRDILGSGQKLVRASVGKNGKHKRIVEPLITGVAEVVVDHAAVNGAIETGGAVDLEGGGLSHHTVTAKTAAMTGPSLSPPQFDLVVKVNVLRESVGCHIP